MEDSNDENIANLADGNNDSMVGDINQLISDLNKGQVHKPSSSRQLEDVVDHDSFEKQARALYFDLTTGSEIKGAGVPADYVDDEYSASATRKPSGSHKLSGSSERESKKFLNKQKYIEQSAKAQLIQQNINAASSLN